MANVEIAQITFNAASDVTFFTPSITLKDDKGWLFTIELVNPLIWPRQQFLLVEPRLIGDGQEYRINNVRKIYPGAHRDLFSVPIPKEVFSDDPDVSFAISPRYYGPVGLRAGNTTIRIAYEDKGELDLRIAV